MFREDISWWWVAVRWLMGGVGPNEVMHESRQWPRPMPRAGKDISITFGDLVDREAVLEPFRKRWQALKEKAQRKLDGSLQEEFPDRLGELTNDELRYGPEAVELRKEVTMRVRQEVLKVRRSRGLPDEDPKASLVETWREEGLRGVRSEEGRMQDGSWQKDT